MEGDKGNIKDKLPTLSPKQQRFVDEYLLDNNACQAAIRAGYSRKGANGTGSRLMANKSITAHISKAKVELAAKCGVSHEQLTAYLLDIVHKCSMKEAVMRWDYAERRLVQEVDSKGQPMFKFDSLGAVKAIELLGKHIGYNEIDNSQKFGDKQANRLTDEQFKELLKAAKDSANTNRKTETIVTHLYLDKDKAKEKKGESIN